MIFWSLAEILQLCTEIDEIKSVCESNLKLTIKIDNSTMLQLKIGL